MEDMETTNLVEGEAMPETEVENEVENEEFDETEGEDSIEDELEEVEIDGKVIRVSKGHKDHLLRQADYTRKTQEIAEQRKQLEERLSMVSEATEAEANARGEMLMIDAELRRYADIDWATWHQRDPQSAQTAKFAYDQLKEQRQGAEQTYQQAQQQRTIQEQQEIARRLEEGRAQLADIDGWGTPEKQQSILETAQKSYGFTEDEIRSETDPRILRALNDLAEYRKLQPNQTASPKPAA